MKLSRETILTILCILLSISLIVFVVFGCRCTQEGFEDGEGKEDGEGEGEEGFEEKEKEKEEKKEEKKGSATPATPAATFTDKEKDLFDDLMKGSVSDENIQKLIANGTLNTEVVEKFLAQLENVEKPDTAAATAPKSKASIPVPEGFTGSMGIYAAY